MVSAGVTAWRLIDVIDNVQVLPGLRDNPIVRASWSLLSDPRLHGALLILAIALGIFYLARRAKAPQTSNLPTVRPAQELEPFRGLPEIPLETTREPLADDEEEIEVLIKYRRRRRLS